MAAQLVVAVVVIPLHGCFLDGSVHPFDLAVGPWMIGLCQAVLDAIALACAVERMPTPSGSRTRAVLRQVGELDCHCR